MSAARLGANCIVLHGHLPWVHHPQHDEFLEEDWFLEAVLETYLPLLFVLDNLARDGIPARLAIGLTPPLLEMLRAPVLREKVERRLKRQIELSESEIERLAEGDPRLLRCARHYAGRMRQLMDVWRAADGDLVAEFRRHQDEGRLEILASCATHAVLPLVATEAARRLQIDVGVALYEEVFGRKPAGFWLPECAFEAGVDRLLRDAGITWVVLETHALTDASPPPPPGVFRPLSLPAGVLAFGRDPESSRQVWATEVGYPGDPDYREFYRDLGFDGAYDDVRPWLHDDGVRRNLGIKYHRVTGDVALHDKQLYDPARAADRAREHADHFLEDRGHQARALAERLGEPAVIVSPYDMELFGHWWYEGPWFLEQIFRRAATRGARPPVRLVTPGDVMRESGSCPAADPPLSTWGEDGYLKVWLNEENAWILRQQNELEHRLAEAASRYPKPDAGQRRLLDQMARELLLAQSSDWAFIVTQQTTVHYAAKRVTDHVSRFLRIEAALDDPASLDDEWLETVTGEDALFPGLDHRGILGKPCVRPDTRLGSGG